MIVAFVFAIGGLFTEVKMPVLFNTTESHASYLPYALAALPYLLTSFGYHGNIPGLVTYYRKDGKAVMKKSINWYLDFAGYLHFMAVCCTR